MTKRTYYAKVTGFILGEYRHKGTPIHNLTEEQAKYPRMAGLITEDEPKASADKAPAPTRAEPSPTMIGKKTR